MSLRWRLALILAAVVAAAVAIASTAAYLSAERELREGIDRALVQQADDIPLVPPARQPPRGDRPLPGDAQTLSDDGQIISSTADEPLPVDDVDIAVAEGRLGRTFRDVTIDGEPYRILTTPRPFGAVQVARDLAELADTLDRLRNRLLVLGLIGAAVAAATGWLVASRFTRPIRRLTSATTTLADGEVSVDPIPVDRHDEVGELAESFNTMTAALARSRRQQQQLVMDASHELRTPLTTLRTNIELLLRAPDLASDDRRQALETATLEIEELTALVAELVELATEQRGETTAADPASFESVDLGRLAGAVVDRARRRTGRTIQLALDQPATVRGVPARLTRALSNLLDNADKFSPPDRPIDVTVQGSSIVVEDQGPGVDPADRERIFDRFHRADTARTLPGSGLGLAIVAQIATDHGGHVSVDDREGGGARFTLALPATTG